MVQGKGHRAKGKRPQYPPLLQPNIVLRRESAICTSGLLEARGLKPHIFVIIAGFRLTAFAVLFVREQSYPRDICSSPPIFARSHRICIGTSYRGLGLSGGRKLACRLWIQQSARLVRGFPSEACIMASSVSSYMPWFLGLYPPSSGLYPPCMGLRRYARAHAGPTTTTPSIKRGQSEACCAVFLRRHLTMMPRLIAILRRATRAHMAARRSGPL